MVVAVLDDLLFTVKIQDAAKRAGLAVQFARTRQEALERAREQPALLLLDLNHQAVEPVSLVEALKGDAATAGVRVLAFVSHVQEELRRAAKEAGADVVMPRSKFTENLPELLRREAGGA